MHLLCKIKCCLKELSPVQLAVCVWFVILCFRLNHAEDSTGLCERSCSVSLSVLCAFVNSKHSRTLFMSLEAKVVVTLERWNQNTVGNKPCCGNVEILWLINRCCGNLKFGFMWPAGVGVQVQVLLHFSVDSACDLLNRRPEQGRRFVLAFISASVKVRSLLVGMEWKCNCPEAASALLHGGQWDRLFRLVLGCWSLLQALCNSRKIYSPGICCCYFNLVTCCPDSFS